MTTIGLRSLLLVAALGAVAACDDAPASPLASPAGTSAAAPADEESANGIAANGVAADGSEEAAPPVVEISRSRFAIDELRVEPGTTVVFVNTDAFAHTVTSRDAAPVQFDSGELGEGARFEVTFDEPGEYPYFCRIHPTMRATVIVG